MVHEIRIAAANHLPGVDLATLKILAAYLQYQLSRKYPGIPVAVTATGPDNIVADDPAEEGAVGAGVYGLLCNYPSFEAAAMAAAEARQRARNWSWISHQLLLQFVQRVHLIHRTGVQITRESPDWHRYDVGLLVRRCRKLDEPLLTLEEFIESPNSAWADHQDRLRDRFKDNLAETPRDRGQNPVYGLVYLRELHEWREYDTLLIARQIDEDDTFGEADIGWLELPGCLLTFEDYKLAIGWRG